MADSIIVGTTLRSCVKEKNKEMNLGSDLQDELDKKVRALVGEACRRAKENGRVTVQARDL